MGPLILIQKTGSCVLKARHWLPIELALDRFSLLTLFPSPPLPTRGHYTENESRTAPYSSRVGRVC